MRKYYFNDEGTIEVKPKAKDIIFYKQGPNFKEEVFIKRFYQDLH